MPLKNSPLKTYKELVRSQALIRDSAQEEVMNFLDDLYFELILNSGIGAKDSLLNYSLSLFSDSRKKHKGIYIWGGVGRGKTMLMDVFFGCLPEEIKIRYHFHRFMQKVHSELKAFSGTKNPMRQVAQKFADEAKVICFDEFYVSDIGDAMIFAELLKELFERKVYLVATSNVEPVNLYSNGLQRSSFMPAIKLLQEYTKVISLTEGSDFRLRTLTKAEIYHFPLGERTKEKMNTAFSSLLANPQSETKKIKILGREICVLREGGDVVWFDFFELCDGPRSQNDYIEISKIYQSVLISDLPVLTDKRNNAVRRLISLVDEFYDRGVKLILSADCKLEELYQGRQLQFEFARTRSRLSEMQSYEYLSREHR